MEHKTKVLIIGAGPTGLMAACQLRKQGIEPIIIDKKEGPTKESRALVVHARTLEIYDQMGIVNEALLKGEIVNKAQFIVKSKKVSELPLDKIGEGMTPFPFLLVLEQSRNEELLYTHLKKLGGEVEWNSEMVSLLQEDNQNIVGVKKGKETIDIKPDYIIAADGAKSIVREALALPFEGDTYEQIFYVADTAVVWKWGKEALSVCTSAQSFLGLFPMQGKDRFRVIGVLPASFQNEHPQSFEEIIPLIQEQIGIPLKFSDTAWFSVYRLHHRCLEHFRKGNVFFAGDAAHIHSPAGGQGMNTGLQDAYNLAWKLAMVIRGTAGDSLLDTYEQERLPFAKYLMSSTDRMFNAMTSVKCYHRVLRLSVFPRLMPLLGRFKNLRSKAFRNVSQIAIKYINSDLTVNRILQSLPIKAGERFLYLKTKDCESVYHLMRESAFHALVFATSAESKLLEEMKILQTEIGKQLQVIDLSEEEQLCASLKIKKDVVVLVRPDHYIGLITDEGAKVVGDYLKRLGEQKKNDGVRLQKTHP
jgi:2-polyprenyl-6-methoxyphenol hydroxylase-like FAD-dependent oxidoreductase